MSTPSQLDLLIAGLLSHGFKELSPDEATEGFRRFQRFGREDRWVRERDCALIIGDLWKEDYLLCPEGSDQHKLLRKCGAIYCRTKERQREEALYRREPKARQKKLDLSADDLLDGL
jgi:hypothetical protein